jgi:hypothetical protein
LGGYFGIAGYNEDYGSVNYSATMIGIGARAAWHFNFLKNLDTYAGLNLGWMIYNQKVHTEVLGVSSDANNGNIISIRECPEGIWTLRPRCFLFYLD